MKTIDYNFKLFSAFAIVLIVVGHVSGGTIGFGGPFDLFPPYAYHVAAFVFVSGYFYNPSKEDCIQDFIWTKIKRMIIPLYLISFVYGCIWTFLKPAFGMNWGETLSIHNIFISPLTTGHQYSINSPMWFIAPLFFAELFNVLLRKVLALCKIGGGDAFEAVLFVLYLGLGSIAILRGGANGISEGWMLLLCRTLFFVSCFGMGRFYHAVLERYDTFSSVRYFSVVLVAQMLVTILSRGNCTYVSSWCRFPGGVLTTFVSTMLCIAFLLRVSKVLGPVFGKSKAVLALADNTFSIMCHHLFGVFLLNCALYFISSWTPFLNGFDVSEFHRDIWYTFAPYGCKQFAFVYLLAGVGFSLAVHSIWCSFHKRLKAWKVMP